MNDDIQWLIGLLATGFAGFAGALFATFRSLSNKWSEGNKAIYQKIEDGDTKLNSKIDDVKDRYVRRDDLDAHIERVETAIQAVRVDQREQTRQLLEAITKATAGRS
jgi:hypothetical protein